MITGREPMLSALRLERLKESSEEIVLRTTLVLVIAGMLGFSVSYEIKGNVLNDDTGPQQLGAFLKQNIPTTAVIETWEREIGVLTNHTYHYPDQIFLKETQGRIFRDIQDNYALGSDYFQKINPNYLIIGSYARQTELYDTRYLIEHACLLSTFGADEAWRYEVYRIDLHPRSIHSSDQIPACSLKGN